MATYKPGLVSDTSAVLEPKTLYEGVGLAIDRFRRREHVKYDPKGLHVFIVESREPGTQHRLTNRGPLGRRHIEDVYRDWPIVRDRRIDFCGDIRSRVID
jgi:hypothetical protein